MAQRLPVGWLLSACKPPLATLGGAARLVKPYRGHEERGRSVSTHARVHSVPWPLMNSPLTAGTPVLSTFRYQFPWNVRGLSSSVVLCRSTILTSRSVGLRWTGFPSSTVASLLRGSRVWLATPTRGVVLYSKRGKRKTVKAVAKRFIRTGSGKLKYWPAGKTHNMLAKSPRKRRQLRKARYANKTQLKTLNKMISGW